MPIELWYKRMENWNIQNQSGESKITVIIPPYLLPRMKGPKEMNLK